ncbi:MAG TPA: aminotransferase class V-fold PLP-dependent enzyme [Verrucomicrobiae bacterium]|nr:aminotransferase class V-fold PLP-dependent enzyme [Verrucomicrobiae bacterium]
MNDQWPIDPRITFLNHGSFGSCPCAVLAFQQNLRDRLERQPVQFLVRDLEPMLDEARRTLAEFVGANPDNLVFVPNATTGVNAILRSLTFQPGDELLVTDHEYNACRNAIEFVAARTGAKVIVAALPFPVGSSAQLLEAITSRITSRTRLALIDHVTSQTALILPIAAIVRELAARGVDTLVDGAHGPGMVPLRLEELGAAYYTGNCHKWLCAPKTVALLHVRPDRQHLIHPLSISHGLNSPRKDRSRYIIEFGWVGTYDPTAYLSVPESLRYLGNLLSGGWPEIQSKNRALALAARKILCQTLQIPAPCPDELIGAMASIPIPDARENEKPTPPHYIDTLQDQLLLRHAIEVPVISWPKFPKRLLRISAQLYNERGDYEKLAQALRDCRA